MRISSVQKTQIFTEWQNNLALICHTPFSCAQFLCVTDRGADTFPEEENVVQLLESDKIVQSQRHDENRGIVHDLPSAWDSNFPTSTTTTLLYYKRGAWFLFLGGDWMCNLWVLEVFGHRRVTATSLVSQRCHSKVVALETAAALSLLLLLIILFLRRTK